MPGPPERGSPRRRRALPRPPRRVRRRSQRARAHAVAHRRLRARADVARRSVSPIYRFRHSCFVRPQAERLAGVLLSAAERSGRPRRLRVATSHRSTLSPAGVQGGHGGCESCAMRAGSAPRAFEKWCAPLRRYRLLTRICMVVREIRPRSSVAIFWASEKIRCDTLAVCMVRTCTHAYSSFPLYRHV